MSIAILLQGFIRQLGKKDWKTVWASIAVVPAIVLFCIGSDRFPLIGTDDLASFDIVPTRITHEWKQGNRRHIDRLVVRTRTQTYHIEKYLYDELYSTSTVYSSIDTDKPLRIWVRSRSGRRTMVMGFRNTRISMDPSIGIRHDNLLSILFMILAYGFFTAALCVWRLTYRRIMGRYMQYLERLRRAQERSV